MDLSVEGWEYYNRLPKEEKEKFRKRIEESDELQDKWSGQEKFLG